MYLLIEWSVLPLWLPEESRFTPGPAEPILHSRPPSERPHPLRGTSAPLHDPEKILIRDPARHALRSPRRTSVQLSRGFQLLLAQGLCFYSSLWFRSVHHVSRPNAWEADFRYKANFTRRLNQQSINVQLYFPTPLPCGVVLRCSTEQVQGMWSAFNPCHWFRTVTSSFLAALQLASLHNGNKLPSSLSRWLEAYQTQIVTVWDDYYKRD